MKRIAVAGFQHETNTFAPEITPFSEFEAPDAWPGLLVGEEVLSDLDGLSVSLMGFVEAAKRAGGYDIVPVSWCAAEPASYVTDDAYERIVEIMLDGIKNAGELDGIYLELHGAMVVQSFEDGEGELLRRIRDIVGPDMPITVSFDLHANITPEIVDLASTVNIFRTYPHIDLMETGEASFLSMVKLLSGEPLYCAFRQIPYLVPLTSQHTGSEPCMSLYETLNNLPGDTFFFADIAMGFPPADIYHAGPSVVAYAGTQSDADKAADMLLDAFIDAEQDFENLLLSPAEAVTEAMANTSNKPIVIADAQDNAGAGATSDTTGVLKALIDAKAKKAVLAILNDPEVAKVAHAAGLGAEFEAALGGRSGQEGQVPYHGRFRVEALSNGSFPFTGVMYDGMTASLGLMAVLRILDTEADVRIVIGSVRCQCLDLAIYRHLGIDPVQEKIVVVKSSVHFRADFEPIADKVLVAEAPGSHPCRLDNIEYKNLRAGMRLGPLGAVHR